jgi:hypothetical protein
MIHARETQDGPQLTLPPQAFYWAILDASVLPSHTSAQRRQQQLGYLFEHVLPVPIDQVHAVYSRLDGHSPRVLACAVQRDALDEQIRNQPAEPIALTPSDLPPYIEQNEDAARVDPNVLNLLTGPFEPPRLRRLRQLWLAAVVALIVVVSGLGLIGFERRVDALHVQRAAVEQTRQRLYEQVLGGQTIATARLPAERLLTAELRRLEQTHRKPPEELQQTDVSALLGSLLARWPRSIHGRTSSLSVTDRLVTVRIQLPSTEDVQEVANALGRLDGWTARMPQMSAGRELVQATIQLEPGSSSGATATEEVARR